MYNVVWENGKSYPAPGAPSPKFLSKWFPKVCALCFQLHTIASDSDYLKKIQREWEERNKINDTPPSGWSMI